MTTIQFGSLTTKTIDFSRTKDFTFLNQLGAMTFKTSVVPTAGQPEEALTNTAEPGHLKTLS